MRTIHRFDSMMMLALLLSPTLDGCTPRSDDPARVTVRDSAGIRVVETRYAAWSDSDRWTIDPNPIMSVGSVPFDSSRALFQVAGAVLLDDNRIVVANQGTRELLWFDSLGALRRVVGRGGEGPGEFMRLNDLWRCNGGKLVVNEGTRISTFDTTGRFLDSERVGPETGDRGVWRIEGINASCSSVLIRTRLIDRTPRLGQVSAPPTTLFWRDLSSGARDTVATIPSAQGFGKGWGGETITVTLPWGEMPYWTSLDERVYIGSNKRFETRWFERDDGLRVISLWGGDPRPVTEHDRSVFEGRRMALVAESPELPMDEAIPRLGEFTVPERYPIFSGLLVDGVGNLWIRAYPESIGGWPDGFTWDRHEEPESWWVFDPSGRWLGAVSAPRGIEVMRVKRRRVIGIWKDEYDVEQVHLFRILKPEAEAGARR